MHLVAYDRQSRPTIYSCLACALDRDVEHNRQHMVQTFEEAIHAMPPGQEHWTWITE
jgi:hypothetical protein